MSSSSSRMNARPSGNRIFINTLYQGRPLSSAVERQILAAQRPPRPTGLPEPPCETPAPNALTGARLCQFRAILPRERYTPRPNRSGGKNSRVARQCIPAGDEMCAEAIPNQALDQIWLGYATETVR
jgi:hypothetical protein